MKSGYNEEVVFITYHLVCYSSFLSKKMAENPHLNIKYRWGMNVINASEGEIKSRWFTDEKCSTHKYNKKLMNMQ